MLKTKLFKSFVLIILLFSVLSLYVGIRIIKSRVIDEATTRAQLDLSSAWAVFNARHEQMSAILKLTAGKEIVVDSCAKGDWTNPDLKQRLEKIRAMFNLDFLSLVSPDGKIMLRTLPPFKTGDYRAADYAIETARKGEDSACITLMSATELEQEGDALAERAFLELDETPHARKTNKTVETRGMFMVSAIPVRQGGQVAGVVYGGIMLNRNQELADKIQSVIYKNEKWNGLNIGTTTIFLNDSRIATTVRLPNGNRALGTRVSKKVADEVLDNNHSWNGEAMVVNETYLAAYDPIKDGRGQVVGMLYVGILKKKYDAMARHTVLSFVMVSVFVLFVGLVLSFITAGRLAQPIHRLVEASTRVSNGHHPEQVPVDDGACQEISTLTKAFNVMTATLSEREDKLRALNRSYMETLGFVSHELKSPVATIINYIFLLRTHKLGGLTEKQQKAVKAIEKNSNRLVEMVRHYLNLSRIENGELQPVTTKILVMDEVIRPLVESIDADTSSKGMSIVAKVPGNIVVCADLNMVREIFENLVSNAVKYGKEGTEILISSAVDGEMIGFTVRNSGEGIPAERMGDLFQKFSRVDSQDIARSLRGTGLGLFITKNIVESHGGKIGVKSEVGRWTDFTFTLPVFKEEAAKKV